MGNLGLIGGLGPGATVHYYRELARAQAGEMKGRTVVTRTAHESPVDAIDAIMRSLPSGEHST